MRKRQILALFLAVLTVFALSACAVTKAKPFTRGTIDGNVYESEFAGLTFTKPSSWSYYTDDQISSLLGVTKEFLKDDSAFDETSEGSIIDFFASTYTGSENVNITFSKGTMFTNLNKSIDASIDTIKNQYESLGWSCSVSEKTDAKLGDNNFKMLSVTVTVNNVTMTQYCYFAMCGKYLVSVACTTSTSSFTASDFEAMFS